MERRASPVSSPEQAARHLFRHLHDLGALRRNPLATPFLDRRGDVSLLLDTVARLAQACRDDPKLYKRQDQAERAYTIFMRTVVRREPWTRVADDVGLSRRQFTRDKANFCRHVSVRLADQIGGLGNYVISVVDTDLAAESAAAHVYAERGDVRGALSILHDVACRAASWRARFDALCASARLLAEFGSTPRALQTLREAREFANRCDAEPSEVQLASARLDVIQASILRFSTPTVELWALLNRAGELTRRAFKGGRCRLVDDIARIEYERGYMGAISGQYRPPRRALEHALLRLDSLRAETPLRVDILMLLGSVLRETRSTALEGRHALERAREAAATAGWRTRALMASMALTQIEVVTGNRTAGLAHVRECIDIATEIGTPGVVAIVNLYAAEMVLFADPTPNGATIAQSYLARLAHIVSPGSHDHARVQSLRAGAALLRGDLAGADASASAARATAARLENPRLRAYTSLGLAHIRAKIGDLAGASDLIYEALELSERYASAGSLMRCYMAAAALTGDHAISRRAAELAAINDVIATRPSTAPGGRRKVF
jgi:hypothetical protein